MESLVTEYNIGMLKDGRVCVVVTMSDGKTIPLPFPLDKAEQFANAFQRAVTMARGVKQQGG